MEADEEAATEPEPEPEVRLRSPRAPFSPRFAALPAQPSTILAFQGTELRAAISLFVDVFVHPSAPCQAPKSDVAATKATTKRALLTGLRNGNLEKAVEKMEADEEAATEPESKTAAATFAFAYDGSRLAKHGP